MANIATTPTAAEKRNCCFGCVTVGQGSLAIGIIQIIFSIISIVLYSIYAHKVINYPDEVPEIGENKSLILTQVFVRIFMSLVYLLLSAIMVQGCRTRQHFLIRPWLIWNYIGLPLAALRTLIQFFVLLGQKLILDAFVLLIVSAIGIAILTYFVRVVFYYVEELKGRSQPAI